MEQSIAIPMTTAAMLLAFPVLAIPAQAESIDVDYSFTGWAMSLRQRILR